MIISLFFYIFCFCLDLEIVILNYLILFVIEFNCLFISLILGFLKILKSFLIKRKKES